MTNTADNVFKFVRRQAGDECMTDKECIEFLESLSEYVDLQGEFDIDLEAVKTEFKASG